MVYRVLRPTLSRYHTSSINLAHVLYRLTRSLCCNVVICTATDQSSYSKGSFLMTMVQILLDLAFGSAS
jgi:hypothetical protein